MQIISAAAAAAAPSKLALALLFAVLVPLALGASLPESPPDEPGRSQQQQEVATHFSPPSAPRESPHQRQSPPQQGGRPQEDELNVIVVPNSGSGGQRVIAAAAAAPLEPPAAGPAKEPSAPGREAAEEVRRPTAGDQQRWPALQKQLRQPHPHPQQQQQQQPKHIDPASSASTTNKAPAAAATTLGSVHQFNASRALHLEQPTRQNQPEPKFNAGTSDPSPRLASPNQQQQSGPARGGPVELHFGAKVALSLLAALVLLVASATFVDLNSSAPSSGHDSATATCDSPLPRGGRTSSHGAAHLLHHHLQQQQVLYRMSSDQQQERQHRDQRSPSLSSSSSSILFSSANSVNSASAPILASNQSQKVAHRDEKQGPERSTWLRLVGSRLARWKSTNYSNNLRLAGGQLQQQQSEISELDRKRLRRQEERVRAAVLKVNQFRHKQPAGSAADDEDDRNESQQQTSSSSGSGWSRGQLARQVFLSFSLRHSASLILDDSSSSADRSAQRCAHQRTSPLLGQRSGSNTRQQHQCVCCHRSRLSSLSSINELANGHSSSDSDTSDRSSSDYLELSAAAYCTYCHAHPVDTCYESTSGAQEAQQQQHQQRPQVESVDSLHGLRFLSMIWIIVIHSYSFALRWLFFTNSPTLDNIYKSAATQLLANGTFACDSFFFAGGFLLPYLAFPAQRATDAAAAAAAETAKQGSRRQQAAHLCGSPHHHHHHQVAQVFPRPPSAPTMLGPGVGGGGGSSTTLPAPPSNAEPGRLSPCKQDNDCNRQLQEDGLSSSGSYDSRQSADIGLQQQPPGSVPHPATAAAAAARHQLDSCNDQSIASSCANFWPNCQHHQGEHLNTNEFTLTQVLGNILHRYIRMMPLMMAIIGLSATLLRYLGEGPAWEDSTMMFDKWCRSNWWINGLFLHNFLHRENMCLSHSWYSAVDIQLFLVGQVILFALFRSRKLGILLCGALLVGAQLLTAALTLIHRLPAVPLIASVSEQSMNLYYGEIYIKPYCRASPYLIGILLAYLMRTTSLGRVRLNKWQVCTGWTVCIGTLGAILMAMQPAMNGQVPSEIQSALYSSLSRPLWACATGWMIFACMTKQGGIFASILSARCFIPLSRLTYPAFLIHPIVMAVFYGSRQSSYHFSHILMLYIIIGNIVITYACAFLLSALFELPLLSVERAVKRAWHSAGKQASEKRHDKSRANRQHTAPRTIIDFIRPLACWTN